MAFVTPDEYKRSFDEVNEIFSNLSEEDYKLTERAANEYYQFGTTHFLEFASDKTGLTKEEILFWWQIIKVTWFKLFPKKKRERIKNKWRAWLMPRVSYCNARFYPGPAFLHNFYLENLYNLPIVIIPKSSILISQR